MRSLWMGILPGLEWTRIVVQESWDQTLMKARLPHSPRDARALEMLCQAIALWCGRKVCAALVVDGPDTFLSVSTVFEGSPVTIVEGRARLRPHRCVPGLDRPRSVVAGTAKTSR